MKNKNMISRLMSVITGFAAVLAVCCFFPGNTTLADSEDPLPFSVYTESVLVYYASVSAGEDGGYSEEQELAADVNDDGIINAVDASCILAYYAYVSSSDEELIPIYEFIIRQNELTE